MVRLEVEEAEEVEDWWRDNLNDSSMLVTVHVDKTRPLRAGGNFDLRAEIF